MQFHLVMLAAGFSRRFGSNKLLYKIEGREMYLHTFEKLDMLRKRTDVSSVTVVSQYEEIEEEARRRGFTAVHNANSALGISSSLKLGLAEVQRSMQTADSIHVSKEEDTATKETAAIMYLVGDQPHLRIETLERMLDRYAANRILCLTAEGKRGNPVIFGEKYIPELEQLTGDTGGKQVIRKHPDELDLMEVDPVELVDVDHL